MTYALAWVEQGWGGRESGPSYRKNVRSKGCILHHFEVPLGSDIFKLFSRIVLEVLPFWNIIARQKSNFFPPFHKDISSSPSFPEHAAGAECS